ncbi:hypothetical protein CLV31_1343 [Algoriphagus aquaeductus]|uniref:Uncharacterized protein n=1 Tax=Algoriphagus aquaeductus TaxID=475299 RepID=A0A326RJK2_9BACT|nr:hypothetical protein [Algoriphagus aquaeductus]PZV75476.1 hypothetical protein CLV31_1343 [Algoriphagus aquaeductus]
MKLNLAPLLLLVIASCAKPLVTNSDRGKFGYETWYYPSIPDSPNIDDIVKVNVALLPLPEPPKPATVNPKTFFDLRDSIPHTFLKVIGAKADSIPQIINAIQSDLSKVPTPRPVTLNIVGGKVFRNDVIDEFKVRLLISSVARYYYDKRLLHSNTRIGQLSTTIELIGDNFIIKTIDRLENDLELIDLGTLDRKNEVTFSSDLKGEVGAGTDISETNSNSNTNSQGGGSQNNISSSDLDGLNRVENTSSAENKGEEKTSEERKVDISKKAGVTAALKYENSSTINETLKLQYQRIKTSFSFSEKSLIVTQSSAPNRPISENVFVTLTLKANDRGSAQRDYLDAAQLFKSGSREINDLNNSGLQLVSLRYIPCDFDRIKLSTQAEGVIRSVKNQVRGRNSGEFDDKVIYLPFRTGVDSVDLPSSSLDGCTKLYSMKMVFKDSLGNQIPYEVRSAIHGDIENSELSIFHQDNVSDFREWFFKALKNPGQNLIWDSQILLLLQREGSTEKKNLTSRSIQDISDLTPFFQSLVSIELIPYFPDRGSNIIPFASGNR